MGERKGGKGGGFELTSTCLLRDRLSQQEKLQLRDQLSSPDFIELFVRFRIINLFPNDPRSSPTQSDLLPSPCPPRSPSTTTPSPSLGKQITLSLPYQPHPLLFYILRRSKLFLPFKRESLSLVSFPRSSSHPLFPPSLKLTPSPPLPFPSLSKPCSPLPLHPLLPPPL